MQIALRDSLKDVARLSFSFFKMHARNLHKKHTKKDAQIVNTTTRKNKQNESRLSNQNFGRLSNQVTSVPSLRSDS